MIKKKERERMSRIIYNDISNSLKELVDRTEAENLNPAYILAFQIGLQSDIEDSLKKVKTPSKQSTEESK